MILIVILYLAVSLTALQIMGAEAFGQIVHGEAAPLMIVAQALSVPFIGPVITFVAITAMLGVLLNLLLGLSRVMLGMARRKDLPNALSSINQETKSPITAVWVTALIIALLVLSGDVVFTWSFSAFTVLIYYAITNLSAFMMPAEFRLYPRIIPALGLFGCLFLAFWIEPAIWGSGLAILGIGLIWHGVAHQVRKTDSVTFRFDPLLSLLSRKGAARHGKKDARMELICAGYYLKSFSPPFSVHFGKGRGDQEGWVIFKLRISESVILSLNLSIKGTELRIIY